MVLDFSHLCQCGSDKCGNLWVYYLLTACTAILSFMLCYFHVKLGGHHFFGGKKISLASNCLCCNCSNPKNFFWSSVVCGWTTPRRASERKLALTQVVFTRRFAWMYLRLLIIIQQRHAHVCFFYSQKTKQSAIVVTNLGSWFLFSHFLRCSLEILVVSGLYFGSRSSILS